MNIKAMAPATALGVALSAWSGMSFADTSVDLRHGWNYNEGPGGGSERTTLTFRTSQSWAYGSFSLAYDVTGPFARRDAFAPPGEKAAIAGNLWTDVSLKKIGEAVTHERSLQWGAVRDITMHAELEHASGAGALTYFGAVFNLVVPRLDFFFASVLLRQDWALRGADLQLGGALQGTVPLGGATDVLLGWSFNWGVFGEGEGINTVGPDKRGLYTATPAHGSSFFNMFPIVLVDTGKLVGAGAKHLYAGARGQLSWRRDGGHVVTEHAPQVLFRWVI